MDAALMLRGGLPMRRIKKLVKQVLPAHATIHLIGLRNYLVGEAEIRALKYLVDPHRDSIDIGCDRGAYAYFLSRLSRKVWCFEPLPASAAFLRAAFANASNVAVYPIPFPMKMPKSPSGFPPTNELDCSTPQPSAR
jgi:hypothetical protein